MVNSRRSTSSKSGRATRRARSRRSANRARTQTSGRTAGSSASSTAFRASGTAPSSGATAGIRTRTPSSSPIRYRRSAASRARRSGRSTARATSRSTSTSASSTSCNPASAPVAGRSQAYVIAHEYGHHVQNQLGVLDQIGNDRQGPRAGPSARSPGGLLRGRLGRQRGEAGALEELTQQDINEGLDAAFDRRPHPGADAGPGQSRGLDARLLGAAATLVLAGLRAEARGVRHLLRLDLGTP